MKAVLQTLGSKVLAEWEIAAMKKWWTHHAVHVHSHHRNEDERFGPYIAERVKLPEKLTSDHTKLVAILDKLEGLFAALTVASTAAQISEVRADGRVVEPVYIAYPHFQLTIPATFPAVSQMWCAYESMMLPHLFEEEMISLPLVMAYFKGSEFGPLVGEIVKKDPPMSLGALCIT